MIINKDDSIKSKGKYYSVVSVSQNIIIGIGINGKSKEINIDDIEKIVIKDTQQQKILVDSLKDKLENIDYKLSLQNIPLSYVIDLKKQRKKINFKSLEVIEALQPSLF